MKRISTLFFAFFVLPVAAAAQSDDRSFLQGLLEDNLSGAGREVRIDGFAGALSSEATIEQLTIADDDGVWLTLTDVVLDWNRGALLRGRLEVNRLSAASIDLPRLPQAADDPEPPAPEASGFSLPELPVSVSIGEISSPSITLGQPVLGVAAEFRLTASMQLSGGEGIASLGIVRTDGVDGTFDLDVGYSNTTEVLDLNLTLDEAPGGIVATLANLPGAPSVALAVEGEGPLDGFEATLALATGGEDRLAGVVVLGVPGDTSAEPGPLPFRAEIGGDVAPLFAPDYREFFGPEIRLRLAGTRAVTGALEFDDFSLTARAITLDGNLALAPSGLPSRFSLAGGIASGSGAPVLLPIPGERTLVDRVSLDLSFDAEQNDTWTGAFRIAGLDRPGFSAATVAIDGVGQIGPDSSNGFTANIQFAAEDLDLGDPEAERALGERVSGRLDMSGAPDRPLEIARLILTGETYGLDAEGTLDTADRDLAVSGQAAVRADDLSVFAGLARRPLGGAAELTIAGEGAVLGGRFDVTLEGRTRDVAIGIPQADSILAGTGSVSLDAIRDETGLTVEALRVSTGVARITASGTAKSTGSSLDLTAALDDAALLLPGLDGRHELSLALSSEGELWAIRSSLAGDAVSGAVDGTFDGRTAIPAFDGTLALNARNLAPFGQLAGLPGLAGAVDGRFAGRVKSDLSSFDARLGLDGRGLATGLASVDPLLTGGVALTLDAARSGGPLTLRTLDLATSGVSAQIAGTVTGLPPRLLPDGFAALADGTTPQVFDGSVRLDASDLSVLAPLAGLPGLAGAVNADLEGQVVSDLSDFDLRLGLDGRGLATGLASVDPLLTGGVALALDAARSGGPLTLRTLDLAASGLSAQIGGTVTGLPPRLLPDGVAALADGTTPQVFDGSVRLDASDLSVLAPLAGLPGLAGAVNADLEGQVVSDLSDFDLRLGLDGRGLATGLASVDPLLTGGVALALDAARSGGPLTIRTLDLAASGLSAQIGGTVTGLPQRLLPDGLAALADGSVITGFDGSVRLDAADLSVLAPLAGLPGLAGAVNADLEGQVVSDLSDFDLRLGLDGRSLATGLASVDPLLTGEVALALDAARSGGPLTIRTLDLAASGLSAQIGGTVTGLPPRLLPDGVAALADRSAVPVFDGSASFSVGSLAPFGPLAGLPGLSGSVDATARGSVAADLSALDLTLDANGVNLGTGIAAADAFLRGGSALALDAARDGSTIALRRARFASPALTARLEGEMGPGGGELAAELSLDNIGRVLEGFSGPASVSVTAARTGDAPWQTEATATGPGGTTMRATGTVSPDFASVDLGITGSAPLGLANTFIAPRSISGQAAFDLRVSGPPALSSVAGRIGTSDARLVAPTLGIVLENLQGDVSLAGSSANIDLTSDVQGGGRIRLSGSAGLDAPFPGALRADLTRVRLTDPELYETRVSGQVTVEGPLAGGALIAGRLSLSDTEIRIPTSVSGGLEPIPEITHVGEPSQIRATRGRAGILAREVDDRRGGPAYPLDVRIDAENQIFVRGRGLDAELGGRLQIRGSTDNVVPDGRFELIRGRLDILGKRLVLNEGAITIQGDFNPFIRLVATTDAEDVTVRIVIEGLASDPEIRFESDPDLPEDEILARLIFGRGIQTLSPFQAAQLASAVATLSGRGNGVMGKLREGIGLDDFDVTTDEEGGAAVRAGKYLSENIYTDVVIGSEGKTEIQLNFDLTPSVTVTGRATDDGETGIGITYERDY